MTYRRKSKPKKPKPGLYVGLRIVYPVTVQTDQDRRNYVREQLQYVCREVRMPCGTQYWFTGETVPTDDMGCKCNDSSHWVVMWRRVDAD